MKKNKTAAFLAALMVSACAPQTFLGASNVIVAEAHSGRTDANGGHRDKKNVSGLGSYHYHCGGHPAHLHTNGVPAIFAREPKKLGAPQIATVSSVNPRGNRTISRTIFRIICHRLRLKYFQLRPRSAPNIKGKSGMINCSISNTHLKGSIS